MRLFFDVGWAGWASAVARRLARAAGVAAPSVRWRKVAGPYFGNAIARLVFTDRCASVVIEGTGPDGALRPVARTDLA